MDSNEASNSKETLSTRSTSEAELEPKWVWCRTVVVDEPAESVDEDHGDGYFRNGKFERRKGLNWVVTGLFLIGDIITGGLVALPSAMIQSYLYIGLGLNLLTAVVACYTSYVLGLCWVILLRRWPEYRSHCRKPYAELGYRAVGPKMKFIVSVCLNITQFGIAVVYLLLSSKNIHDFVQWASGTDFNDCYVILCVALGLLPITFLKSPADFWYANICFMGWFKSIQSWDAPIQSQDAPIQRRDAHIRSQDALIQSQDAPIQSQDAPIQSQDAPIQSQDSPIQSQDAPIQSQDAPIQSQDAPIQRRDAHIRSQDALIQSQGAPIHGQDAPIHVQDAPIQCASTG